MNASELTLLVLIASHFFFKRFAGNCFIDLGENFLSEAFSETHEKGWVKGLFVDECFETEKVLQIGIFPDLLNGFLITGTQARFYD